MAAGMITSLSTTKSGLLLLTGALSLAAGCEPSGSASDAGSSPLCGDGVIDAGELCDDGNLTPGDGCSPGCLPSGMPYDCFDLLEDPENLSVVNDLHLLADGSVLAAGRLGSVDADLLHTDRGWIARYEPTGEQLWFVDTITIDPQITLVLDMVGDGGSGVWTLGGAGYTENSLIHIDDDGSVGAPVPIDTQADAAVHVAALEFTAAGVWLAGDRQGDAWVGLYDPESGVVTDLLVEDHLGFNDYVHAIARADGEVAVAATLSTSPNFDDDGLVTAATEILVVHFDLEGDELRRTLLSPNPDPEFVRFAQRLVFDQPSNRWYVGGNSTPKQSTAGPWRAWFATVEAQAGWQWTHDAPFGDLARGQAGLIMATTWIDVADGLRGELTSLAADGTVRWTFGRTTDDVANYEDFRLYVLARGSEGQLRTAGRLHDVHSRKLRSCLVAE